ncbi:MAG: tRNA (adenine-N1)-methyltransferase [Actinomycetales bacterium]|nr:tRNA (adenine-N1)-methyltransferase [Actinomycetales bacterium]
MSAGEPGSGAARGPFRVGDRVQLSGPRGKVHSITLAAGGRFGTHRGEIRHDQLIGIPDGSVVEASNGDRWLALRPLLSDFVMAMPRGAAIVYPKDAAQILQLADVFPGATVVEAGVGSGALTLWLLRGVGPEGRLLSIERRDEFADIARANVAARHGGVPANWSLYAGDLREALPAALDADPQLGPGSVDRVVLDMLAPWECLDAVADALAPGGVLVCYVATVTQLSRTAEAIRARGGFTQPQASETLVRGWHLDGLAVRPDHRMVAHTGFLLQTRRLAPGVEAPEPARRGSKTEYGEEDVELWTPGALGERPKSDKRMRRVVRDAEKLARETGAEPGAGAAPEVPAGEGSPSGDAGLGG